MSKRKTALDKAIAHIDTKIEEHRAQINALVFAREHLIAEQQQKQPRRGSTEGGHGI